MKYNEIHNMTQKPEPKPDTYEAGMAQNQLLKIGTHAIKIHNMIDDDAEMEAWVAKKIDLASNYVKSVHGYTAGSKAGTYDDGGMTEDAPFGSGMDLVRMAVLRKFISAEEYMNYGNELKAAAKETAENYDDWPEGEGFGSSDGNFAIKDGFYCAHSECVIRPSQMEQFHFINGIKSAAIFLPRRLRKWRVELPFLFEKGHLRILIHLWKLGA